jgi:lipopolysaccharide export system permease protein
VPLMRFVRPLLRMAWPVLLVIGVLVLFVWPWGNRQSADLKTRYEQRSDLSRVAPGVFQSSRDGKRVFFVERESPQSINAKNVFILSTLGDREAVTSAQTGRLTVEGDERWLTLDAGQRNEQDSGSGDKQIARFETYRILVGEDDARRAQAQPPRAMNTVALLQDPTPKHQGELAWRLGLLFGAANLMLLGLGLSATNPRRASNWNLLFALLAFIVYYNFISLSQAWIAASKAEFGVMLLLLHGLVFALALTLIWWRDNGINFSFKRASDKAATA